MRAVLLAFSVFFASGCDLKAGGKSYGSCGDKNLLVPNPIPHQRKNEPDSAIIESILSGRNRNAYQLDSYYDSIGVVGYMLGLGHGLDLDLMPSKKMIGTVISACHMKNMKQYAVHSLHGTEVDYLYFAFKRGIAKRVGPDTLDGDCEPFVQLDKVTGGILCVDCRFCRDAQK